MMKSHVYLGLNHSYLINERPLIYETMVFHDRQFRDGDIDMERYSNRKEALAGHRQMVKKWADPQRVCLFRIEEDVDKLI